VLRDTTSQHEVRPLRLLPQLVTQPGVLGTLRRPHHHHEHVRRHHRRGIALNARPVLKVSKRDPFTAVEDYDDIEAYYSDRDFPQFAGAYFFICRPVDRMFPEMVPKGRRGSVVEQYLHGQAGVLRCSASWLRTAVTCHSCTSGYHSRNCFTVAPLSRFSKRA